MHDQEAFLAAIQNGYTFKGTHIKIGVAMLDGAVVDGADVNLPLGMMNRHGLIAGATGTGKTKTLQVIAEALSDAGVPVLLMDIKGDLSGIAAAGTESDKIKERYQLLKETYKPAAYPAELLSLSQEKGARLRATVSEFGPVLLAKVLDLNDTQAGLLSMLFKYCDDKGLPLLDLKDLSRVLQYAGDEGKADIEKDYGKISTTSTGTILRKVIELQQQGADQFFGELSFEVADLMHAAPDGRGMVNILRVTDMQDRPKLFSTFMLQLLAELYATLPEEGDSDKPKLVLFIDEAHLIFKEATKVLLSQIETIVKLIRSKGVGVFFCTQNPQDIPASVLSQLGFKLQHALRAFTANDRKDIKQTAENYPESTFYTTEDLITQLGIGEALITLLNEKGVPTPLAHTFLISPRSRMDILSAAEIDTLTASSRLIAKYNEATDRESAYEMLNRKLDAAAAQQPAPAPEAPSGGTARRGAAPKEEKSWLERAINSSAGKQVQRSVVRTLFGVIQKMFK
ncbi:helicase HerA-like domain-containing protein [Taibaiella koreensis]|uniref:helicase HerA-like domain-containing protein n=1 Tax=Taibaiella koreensis TaxID=1268548 RepID=UPI000E59AFFF|nr:helicase HerA-like domain-containing protein [Taibaiella koreensis]